MSESIAAQKNLKALRLCVGDGSSSDLEDEAAPLTKLSNLEHLSILSRSWGSLVTTREKILQSVLLNSLSTLKSLEISTSKWHSSFLGDWEDQIKARNPDAMEQAHDFTALRSLSLSGVAFAGDFCETMMPSLTRAIDFLQLRELTLKDLSEGKVTFFKYLEDLFRGADKGTVQLRKLSLDMSGDDDSQSYVTTEYQVEGIYRFISSFDTLTTLEFAEHNMYNSAVESNPGLSRRLLQVVLNHKELETLRFTYRGSGSGDYRVPYVPAKTVQILMKNLLNLRTFEFAPDEDDLVSDHFPISAFPMLTLSGCHVTSYRTRQEPRNADYLILPQRIHAYCRSHPVVNNHKQVIDGTYGKCRQWRGFCVGELLQAEPDQDGLVWLCCRIEP
jgi:hypothetical protein